MAVVQNEQVSRLLTREKAAKWLGVSIATFDRLRYAGQIHAVHLTSRRVGFTVEELERFVREHTESLYQAC
jgi:predicted site-specific integrase-resolvase